MQFFSSQCPRCGVGTSIDLRGGILNQYLWMFPPSHAGDLIKKVSVTVGRQNLTHFVCGPTRAVCHYAWSMVN